MVATYLGAEFGHGNGDVPLAPHHSPGQRGGPPVGVARRRRRVDPPLEAHSLAGLGRHFAAADGEEGHFTVLLRVKHSLRWVGWFACKKQEGNCPIDLRRPGLRKITL